MSKKYFINPQTIEKTTKWLIELAQKETVSYKQVNQLNSIYKTASGYFVAMQKMGLAEKQVNGSYKIKLTIKDAQPYIARKIIAKCNSKNRNLARKRRVKELENKSIQKPTIQLDVKKLKKERSDSELKVFKEKMDLKKEINSQQATINSLNAQIKSLTTEKDLLAKTLAEKIEAPKAATLEDYAVYRQEQELDEHEFKPVVVDDDEKSSTSLQKEVNVKLLFGLFTFAKKSKSNENN